MYQNLGNQWASSIPAFLALACTPLPFLFHAYGDTIRARSKYAAKARRITATMLNDTKSGGGFSNAPSKADEAAVRTSRNGVNDDALQELSSAAQQGGEKKLAEE